MRNHTPVLLRLVSTKKLRKRVLECGGLDYLVGAIANDGADGRADCLEVVLEVFRGGVEDRNAEGGNGSASQGELSETLLTRISMQLLQVVDLVLEYENGVLVLLYLVLELIQRNVQIRGGGEEVVQKVLGAVRTVRDLEMRDEVIGLAEKVRDGLGGFVNR